MGTITKRFIQGDCMEEINKLNKRFNLILTDPPYNIGWEYSNKINDNRKDYNEWCIKWAELCLRKLTDDGVLAIINYPENNNILFSELTKRGHAFHEQLIWYYPTNIGHSKTKYTRNYRTIIIFSFYGKRNKFNPIKQPYKNPTDKRIKQRIAKGYKGTNHYATFEFNLCKNVSKDKKNNGINQLPRELVEMLIKTYTNEGDNVLDPFVGNRTIMNIAEELNRNSVGIDINNYALDSKGVVK